MREIGNRAIIFFEHQLEATEYSEVSEAELIGLRQRAAKHVLGRSLTEQELADMDDARQNTGMTQGFQASHADLGYMFGGSSPTGSLEMRHTESFDKKGKFAILWYRSSGTGYTVSIEVTKTP